MGMKEPAGAGKLKINKKSKGKYDLNQEKNKFNAFDKKFNKKSGQSTINFGKVVE